MTRLDSMPTGYALAVRDRFAKFLEEGTPEKKEIEAAVAEMTLEFGGYMDAIAKAASTSEKNPLDREDVNEGIQHLASFALWRLLVAREEGGTDD